MSENSIQYDNLKKEIIRKCGDTYDIQKLKNSFSIIVDSRRTLSRIRNLNDLFHVLEERDELNSNNVSALYYLVKLLGNEDIINLVCGYKKLYIEDETNTCAACGEDLTFSFPLVNPERVNSIENKLDGLETAMNNVAINIGKSWHLLARELKVPECYIDEIREKYPGNMNKQAFLALQIWRKYNNDNVTIDILKLALEARLCKMKGIGIHMLNPVITVD